MAHNARHYQSLINFWEGRLRKTDYIVIKIYEAEILGQHEQAEELKEKYRSPLQERETVREKIREYERLRDAEYAKEKVQKK